MKRMTSPDIEFIYFGKIILCAGLETHAHHAHHARRVRLCTRLMGSLLRFCGSTSSEFHALAFSFGGKTSTIAGVDIFCGHIQVSMIENAG
jgi:hypothetical protein